MINSNPDLVKDYQSECSLFEGSVQAHEDTLVVERDDNILRTHQISKPSIAVLYGINGVGKDTLATYIKSAFLGRAFITSESRLLMHRLGIIDHADSSTVVPKKAYQALELTSQMEIAQVEDGIGDSLEILKDEHGLVIFVSHLVFALHTRGREITYLTEKPYFRWIGEVINTAIQIKAEPDQILQRRVAGLIERERPTSISQIREHQELCE